MIIKIVGNPVPQGRPRFFRRGSYVGAYDPGKSKSWKEMIALQAVAQGARKLEGALSMNITFVLPRPKSLPKKVIHHVKKPDLDNLTKACLDGLKGICFRDDSQIVISKQAKYYENFEVRTGVTIELKELL